MAPYQEDLATNLKTVSIDDEARSEISEATKDRQATPQPSEPDTQTQIQFKIVSKDGEPKCVDEEEFFGKQWDGSGRPPPIQLVRTISPHHGISGEVSIHLTSNFLRRLFQESAANSTFQGVEVTPSSIIIRPPYLPLFHHLESLKSTIAKDEAIAEDDREELRQLEDVCNKPMIRDSWNSIKRDLDAGQIAYSDLWALYRPDDEVLVKTMNKDDSTSSVMRICFAHQADPNQTSRFYMGSENRDTTRHVWSVVLLQNSWNGFDFRDDFQIRILPRFSGKTRIQDLDIVPLSRLPNGNQIREDAVTRGKKWHAICRGQTRTMMYEGLATPLVGRRQNYYWKPAMKPEQMMVRSRVIVDPKAMLKVAKLVNLNSDHEILKDDELGELDNATPLAERFRLGLRERPSTLENSALCPLKIPVFSLNEQMWFRMNIDLLKEVEWRPETFEQLQIAYDRKLLLARLIEAHSMGDDARRTNDMVIDKGKGLIMLFYGPSGVGKTLTAETLSERTGKPLYKVNLGVLSRSYNWEATLDLIFECAHDWKAILLIDEADVVMEERTVLGREQNRWASVLLRKIEYYQGVLILTTNLVNVLDEAFRSRITIGMEFEDLDPASRSKIWKDFIERGNRDLIDRDGLLGEVPEWSQEPLNARQIRNIWMSAELLAIARRPGGKLNAKDVNEIKRYVITSELKDKATQGTRSKLVSSMFWGD